MANETVDVLTVKINGVDQEINSLKKLKQARKDLQSEFLAGNEQAAKSLAVLDDKMEELKETTISVKGSGVEKLNASVGLLSEGFANFDMDKIKTGFKGLGAAMSTIPILLLVEGAKLLVENFDVVVKFFSSTARESERIAKSFDDQKKKSDELKTAINSRVAVMEAELGLLKAQGASNDIILAQEIKILEEKKKANDVGIRTLEVGNSIEKQKIRDILNNDNLYESALRLEIQALRKIGADETADQEEVKLNLSKLARSNESKEAILKNEAEIAALKSQNTVIDINESAAVVTAKKDDAKKLNDLLKDAFNDEDTYGAEIDERQKQREADKIAGAKLASDLQKQLNAANVKDAQDNAAKLSAIDKQITQGKQNLYKSAFSTLQSLSTAYFANELAASNGNAVEQAKIKEEQFNIDKAFKIASIAIDTASGVVKTTAELGGVGALTPPGIALIAGMVALGTAEAAIVAATKFNSGSVNTSTGPGLGSSGGSALSPPPPPPQIAPVNQGPNTTIINGPATGQIYMVETQSSAVTNGVRRIESQAKFP